MVSAENRVAGSVLAVEVISQQRIQAVTKSMHVRRGTFILNIKVLALTRPLPLFDAESVQLAVAMAEYLTGRSKTKWLCSQLPTKGSPGSRAQATFWLPKLLRKLRSFISPRHITSSSQILCLPPDGDTAYYNEGLFSSSIIRYTDISLKQ